MPTIYTPSTAAAVLNITPGAIRKYSDLYARYLSSAAGEMPRSFTDADLRVFAFIAQSTARGQTHAAILAELAAGPAGSWGAFDWTPPAADAEPDAPAPTALVSAAQVAALRALLEDAQRREMEARDRLNAQTNQLRDLARELGRVEAEAEALRRDAAELAQRRERDAAELEALRLADAARREQEARDAARPRSWWSRLVGGA